MIICCLDYKKHNKKNRMKKIRNRLLTNGAIFQSEQNGLYSTVKSTPSRKPKKQKQDILSSGRVSSNPDTQNNLASLLDKRTSQVRFTESDEQKCRDEGV